MKHCVTCNTELMNKQRKFCSNKCLLKDKYHSDPQYRADKNEQRAEYLREQRDASRRNDEKQQLLIALYLASEANKKSNIGNITN